MIYDDWNVYRVDLTTLACTQTAYVPGQLGFSGEEGIAVAAVDGVDRLFVYGSNPTPTLAVSDLTSFVLSPVGPATPSNGAFPVAIQGDAFGHVYAFSQFSTFFELDSATAHVSHLDHTSLQGGGNWAVMAYGDRIYLFGAGGRVARYDLPTKRLTPRLGGLQRHRRQRDPASLDAVSTTPVDDRGRSVMLGEVHTCSVDPCPRTRGSRRAFG